MARLQSFLALVATWLLVQTLLISLRFHHNFMKVKVKSMWNGKVALRDKYIDELHNTQDELVIEMNDKKMTIPFEKLDASIKGKSEQPFYDRFSRESHFLIYFDWKPDPELQGSLF